MIPGFLSQFTLRYPTTLIYMLQSSEYQTGPYLAWYWRTKNFNTITKRRLLERTRAARLLLLAIRVGVSLQIVAGVVLMYLGLTNHVVGGAGFGAALLVLYPVLWAHLVVVPLLLGRYFISGPAEQKAIAASKTIFANHPGVRIAVAGSYGKTTMKELLATVLGNGLQVAATPANKNVSSSHALFARTLTGKEDVLIIEYGEGAPGDIARFASITQPTHGIITGLAPAHLDKYKTLKAAANDIFSLANFVSHDQLYVNGDSPETKDFIKPTYQVFNNDQAMGWKVSNTKVDLQGISFTITKSKQKLVLHSQLVGRHQVGFLTLVVTLGLQLGLTAKQVQAGVAETRPFEHRMQPYELGGAWIIDDTYNGNLEGIRAGTGLLKDLKAKRKIYVSPGLVEQGSETELVHKEMGKLIAAANPDLVILMQNSVTAYIDHGLALGGFEGEVRHEADPLNFYTNLNHFVAAGDLVLMQNDWTDNYA